MIVGQFLEIIRPYIGGLDKSDPTYLDYAINLFMSKNEKNNSEEFNQQLHYYAYHDESLSSKILNGTRRICKKYANFIIENLDGEDFAKKMSELPDDTKGAMYNKLSKNFKIRPDEFDETIIDIFGDLISNEQNNENHLQNDLNGIKTFIQSDISNEIKANGENFVAKILNDKYDDNDEDVIDKELPIKDYLLSISKEYINVRILIYRQVSTNFKDIYVCNNIKYQKYKKDNNGTPSLQYNEYLNFDVKQLKSTNDNLLITGTGGLGKSMMLRHLLLNAVETYEDNKLIPVFINIRDYDGPNRNLEKLINNEIETFGYSFYHTQYQSYLLNGKILFLLDGLDEVSKSLKSGFDYELKLFMKNHKNNLYVMTSRESNELTGYENFSMATLMPFDINQSVEAIKKLKYRQDNPNIEKQFIKLLTGKLNETHKDFIENPLLLSIFYMTYDSFGEIPQQFSKFYEMAYMVLTNEHDALKGKLREYRTTGFDSSKFSDIFSNFCILSYLDEKYDFDINEFSTYIKKAKLYERLFPNIDDLKYDLTTGICLLYEESHKLFFTHRSFQEYFAALFLSKESDKLIYKVFKKSIDTKNPRLLTDKMFLMINELNPKLIQRAVIFPFLKAKMEKWASHSEGEYFGFLIDEYPTITYGNYDGIDFSTANSLLLRYILKINNLDIVLGLNKLPDDDIFIVSKHFLIKEKYWDKDAHDTWEDCEETEIPDDYPSDLYPPEALGNVYTIDVSDCIESKDETKYKKAYKTLTSDKFVLKKQFLFLKKLFNELEQEQKKISSDDIII